MITRGFSNVIRVDLSSIAKEDIHEVLTELIYTVTSMYLPDEIEYNKSTSEFLVKCKPEETDEIENDLNQLFNL